MTVPFVIVVALLLVGLGRSARSGGASSSTGTVAASDQALPPITVSPPPSDPAVQAPCTKLVGALPLTLAGQNARAAVSRPSSPFVVAWGDPAIVLRCGVSRPAGLTRSSQLFAVNGVNVLPRKVGGATVFTVVDRPVYVEVTVPSSYAQPPLGPIASVIAKSLGQVCSANQAGQSPLPASQLCVNRR